MQTLDIVSGGRCEFGIGASWLEEEWVAAGLDFATRGKRVDESLAVCKQLWRDPEVEHHGEFFDFGAVAFEPKPVQRPWPPILVGGESNAALRRAARDADGWIGMGHTLESAAPQIEKLRAMRNELHDPDGPLASGHDFQICVGGPVTSKDDVRRWEDLGVTRLVVAPWPSSRQAVEGMTRYAELVGLEPR